MGIPSFYKYIKNAYKDGIGLSNTCPNNVKRLYLDFNGIIHTCKEPVLSENGTEKDIIDAVLKYVEHMILTINPSELLFIAVDGVAPRAKMEQQRKRRYKSCQDAALEPKKEESPKKKKWDSNAITPGTRFMSNMDRELYKSKYLKELSNKISIIISNSSSPGEGEQKIFRHIRSTDDDDDNDDGINVIHGLDADLFMLSLLALPKQIYLYREFDLKPSYVCINTLANRLKKRDKIMYTKDYVLMSFLMGNDFIPKLYALNLRQNALDIVLDLYEKLNEKLVVKNKIQKKTLLNILKELSEKEDELVKNRAETTVYKKLVKHGHSPQDRFHHWPDYHRNLEIQINFGNPGWRERYYQIACEIDNLEENYHIVENMCKQYVNGLAWNFDYYTSKDPVKYCDQSWYYPYLHAPLLEDIVKYLENNDIQIPKSKKQYTSLEQLAIVLPPQSRFLLPCSWRSYVLHEKKQYPWRFKLDPIGCIFRWECAPILPQFNEDFLKVLKENCELTVHEEKRKKKHNDFLLTNDS